MARTVLTPQEIVGPFDAVTAGSLDITFAASDGTGGNSLACTGKEIILAFNDGTAAYTVTVDSVDDEKGRQEDITSYSLAVGDYAAIGVGLTTSKGWIQSGGVLHIDTNNVDVKLAALRLP